MTLLKGLEDCLTKGFRRSWVLSGEQLAIDNDLCLENGIIQSNTTLYSWIETLTPKGSAAFSKIPPSAWILSSSKKGTSCRCIYVSDAANPSYWPALTLVKPAISSSAFEKPVNFFPAKIDLPAVSVAPTRALRNITSQSQLLVRDLFNT